MKKILIAMFSIASLSAMAQEGRHHGPRHGEKSFEPEQIAVLETKRLTLALDLSDAQQEQIKKLQLENARLRKEKMEALKIDLEDGSRRAANKEERFALQSERLDQLIATKGEMKKILTEEQFQKWEKEVHLRRDLSHRKGEEKRKRG